MGVNVSHVYRLYLDACCLNRPFDDQSQDRIRIETEAVIIILKNIRNGKIKLIGSDVLNLEIEKIPDPIRKYKVQSILRYCSRVLVVDDTIKKAASELQSLGLKGFDAFHIASCGRARVDAFVTTDDKIIKLTSKINTLVSAGIYNPINWVQEFL